MGWKSEQCTEMDAHSGGRDPPLPPRIFNGGGDAHRVKGDAHPPLPYEHPSPPYVPVTPYEQLKFLVGNNLSPPSPPQAHYYLPAMVLVRAEGADLPSPPIRSA